MKSTRKNYRFEPLTIHQLKNLVESSGAASETEYLTNLIAVEYGRKEIEMNKTFEELARTRVDQTNELRQYEDTIFYDWPNWDEHMEWIATAPIDEIIDWAENAS